MTAIRWETLITDDAGVVDYARVRSLVSVVLAIAAGVALVGAMLGIVHPHEYVTLGTSALILPITAGKITDAIAGKRAPAAEPPDGTP